MYIPLEDGEKVMLMVHKHWWFIFTRIMALGVFLLVPLAAWGVLADMRWVTVAPASIAAFIALGALWALVGWVLFWQFWTLYYMDMWIVTDRRLIDIDYKGFFDRDIAMLRLEKVQDLTVQVSGILGSVLGFGHILVQTAGSDKEFVIDQISDPERLRDAILQLK
jgi:hypothetical protein